MSPQSLPYETVAATAVVYPGVELGAGSEVQDYAIVGLPQRGRKPGDAATQVGVGALIRSHAVIYAGATLGAQVDCGHGCLIKEQCAIGPCVCIGAHSMIEAGVRLGEGCVIAAGSVVTQDVPAHAEAAGNPARVVKVPARRAA